jgi:hypothetical protein
VSSTGVIERMRSAASASPLHIDPSGVAEAIDSLLL